jgi:uncharacterized protein YigE (DUF2233 family)
MNCRIFVALCVVFSVFRLEAGWEVASAGTTASLPAGSVFIESEVIRDDFAVRIHGVRLDDRKVRFVVVDNPVDGRGTLEEAMRSQGCFAGVNGGYFHADFRPVGLEIAGGRVIHGFERAKLLSGVFAVTSGKPRLMRSGDFQSSSKVSDALQAGPFLVFDGQPTDGLNDAKRARRTVVATDGKNGWAILLMSPVTLADAAAILSTPGVLDGLKVAQALNLDGGSSSALWAATEPKAFYFREYGTVRNYLGLQPK